MFNIGDHVRILVTESRTDYANEMYTNRTGVVAERKHFVGLADCYKVVLDKPFYDHGYLIDWLYIYDYHNGKLEWRKSHETEQEICVSHG